MAASSTLPNRGCPANPQLARVASSRSLALGSKYVCSLVILKLKMALAQNVAHQARPYRPWPEAPGLHLRGWFHHLRSVEWLADVGVSFSMLNRNGRVLFVTGPTASSDVRLRRAQALAYSSGAGLRIARELIDQKLAGQEQVVRYKLLAADCADTIHRYRSELQRPTHSTEFGWLNHVRLLPTGQPGERCRSVFREKMIPSAPTLARLRHAGFPSHRFSPTCSESPECHSELSLQPSRI